MIAKMLAHEPPEISSLIQPCAAAEMTVCTLAIGVSSLSSRDPIDDAAAFDVRKVRIDAMFVFAPVAVLL
jgi:hypothetical protein